jgi:hypothetical protein
MTRQQVAQHIFLASDIQTPRYDSGSSDCELFREITMLRAMRKPRRMHSCGLFISVLFCVVSLLAQEQKAPTSNPSPDLSTPRSAALAWIDATFMGDARTVHQILVDDPKQRDFLSASLRFSAALRALEAAAVQKFGDAGRNVTGYPDGSAKTMQGQLKVEQLGDQAKISSPDASRSLTLRQVEGRWRVDLSAWLEDQTLSSLSKSFAQATRAAEEIAAEIAAGKFQSADEAAAFTARRLNRRSG